MIDEISNTLSLQELPATHISYLLVAQLQSLGEYINMTYK